MRIGEMVDNEMVPGRLDLQRRPNTKTFLVDRILHDRQGLLLISGVELRSPKHHPIVGYTKDCEGSSIIEIGTRPAK